MEKLKPDFYIQHYTDITKEWLEKENVGTILADLDGTLALQDKMPGSEFEDWLRMLEEAECSLIIVSNNNKKRVEEVVKKYKIVGISNCKKPLTSVITKKLIHRGLNLEKAIFLGDQVFTDVWCGKKIGVRTVLVKTLSKKEPFVTRCKRGIERRLIQKWFKEVSP